MPTTNQLLLGAQQRLPKKRMRDKKTPALQGSPQKTWSLFTCLYQKHLKTKLSY